MFCPQCGAQTAAEGKFCRRCGAVLSPDGAANRGRDPVRRAGVGFGQAIRNGFEKYFDFSTRVSRAEYWWFVLFGVLLSVFAQAVDASGIVDSLVSLLLLVPMTAVCTRRLHDTDRSGWWQLLSITIIGLIPLIIWLVQDGDPRTNRFGAPA